VKVLLDTHIWLWWLREDPRLPQSAQEILEDGTNELLWSLVSSWEIAVKISIGKLTLDRPVERLFAEVIHDQGATLLPVAQSHCVSLASLPLHHRDPFDRMLVAQAQIEKVPLMTTAPKIAAYNVEILK
jgi:PIN domain nuclease of toxin-antitoxin system